MIQVNINAGVRISQGNVYRNVEYIERVEQISDELIIEKICFPYIVVMTQDCDLQQDYDFRKSENKNQDKYLLSILVIPLYNYERFKLGEHMYDLKKWTMQPYPEKKRGKKTSDQRFIENNQNPRYHYLEFSEDTGIVPSVIDFKHYFTVDAKYLTQLHETHYVCTIEVLYRERISQRFSNFLARIGLPNPNERIYVEYTPT